MSFEPVTLFGYEGLVNEERTVLCLKVPSGSQEGEFYDVTVFAPEDMVECECKGYQYRAYCKHSREIRTKLQESLA